MAHKCKFLSARESNALELLVTRLKHELKKQLIQIQLFGSRVTGNCHQDSDIDVLLVVKNRSEELIDRIAEINLEIDLKYDPNISLVIFSESEFNQNQAMDTPFMKNIQKESIPL